MPKIFWVVFELILMEHYWSRLTRRSSIGIERRNGHNVPIHGINRVARFPREDRNARRYKSQVGSLSLPSADHKSMTVQLKVKWLPADGRRRDKERRWRRNETGTVTSTKLAVVDVVFLDVSVVQRISLFLQYSIDSYVNSSIGDEIYDCKPFWCHFFNYRSYLHIKILDGRQRIRDIFWCLKNTSPDDRMVRQRITFVRYSCTN